MSDLANLPTELVLIALAHLNGYHRSTNLCALSQTNRRFHAIVTEELNRHLRDVFPPNIEDFEYTVLRKCAQHGKEECVKRLLRAGIRELASPVGFFQLHPINMEARMGHANLVKFFIIMEWTWHSSPLADTLRSGRKAVVKVLIEHGELNEDPLSLATPYGCVSLVKLLLDLGCDPCPSNADIPNADIPNDRPAMAWMIAASMNLEIFQVFVSKGLKLTFPGNPYDWCLARAL
ncbi:unnamed protein product [Penicillium pancosmium]